MCTKFYLFFWNSNVVVPYVGSDGKECTCNTRDPGSIPRLGRSPGEENDNPLQYSCWGNPMDIGAWRATVHGVTKSWTWLSDQHFHFYTTFYLFTFGCAGSLFVCGGLCPVIVFLYLATLLWDVCCVVTNEETSCLLFGEVPTWGRLGNSLCLLAEKGWGLREAKHDWLGNEHL